METEDTPKIKIGLVDDHQLFSKSLSLLLSTFKKFEVVIDAVNGKDLQEKMAVTNSIPDIMLIDVSMPVMDGPQTAEWLTKQYPKIRLVALSMSDKEQSVIHMFKAGCCAYLFKDIYPNELEHALEEVHAIGYYNPSISFQKLLSGSAEITLHQLTDLELEFLRLACSELTYKEVADRMNLSERTIEGYRKTVFAKLNVQSRTGMALEAIRKGLIKM